MTKTQLPSGEPQPLDDFLEDFFADFVLMEQEDLDRLHQTPPEPPPAEGPEGRPTNRPTFDCESCGGSGLWQGGWQNRDGKTHCFNCRGRGYFFSSKAERLGKREAKVKSTKNKLEIALEAFDEQFGLLQEFAKIREEILTGEGRHSDFIRSLVDQLFRKGFLSDKQVNAYLRGKARAEETRAARQAEAKEAERSVDLSKILDMFTTARQSLKRPVYRAEGLTLSAPSEHSSNAGGIYVKSGQDYYGKVIGSTFMPSRDLRGARLDEVSTLLQRIAKNPKEAAIEYGRKTGTCACCGRTLTDPTSISLGIGPICIEKWGF